MRGAHLGIRYQEQGSRTRGPPGSTVTKVATTNNDDGDRLIWVLYDPRFNVVDAQAGNVQTGGKRMALRTVVLGPPASTAVVRGLLHARGPPWVGELREDRVASR